MQVPIRRYKNLVLYWFGGNNYLLWLPYYSKHFDDYEEAKREFNRLVKVFKSYE